MKIKSFVILAVLATAILCFGAFASAQDVPTGTLSDCLTSPTIPCLTYWIGQMSQQLAQMQNVGTSTPPSTPPVTPPTNWCYTFNNNLGFSNSGSSEVAQLHTLLQKENISFGPDSGTTYAQSTADAVAQLQRNYHINPARGWFGPSTRAQMNSIYGCSAGPVQAPPQNPSQFSVNNSANVIWSEPMPGGAWYAVASSSDGTHLIAAIFDGFVASGSGRLYVSSDSGRNWTETQPAGNAAYFWSTVSSSSDGSHLLAGIYSGVGKEKLYLSSNYGITWTETQPAGNTDQQWRSSAMSSDGNNIIVGAWSGMGTPSGRLYISHNFGLSWTEVQPNGNVDTNWSSLASSRDGSHLVAASVGGGYGGLYVSSDSGATWTTSRPAPTAPYENWSAVASSADGSHLIVGNDNGNLYVSSNYGATWTETFPAGNDGVYRNWLAITSSADGSHLAVAAVNGNVYISSNSGASWALTQPAGTTYQTWDALASSSDGSHLLLASRSSAGGATNGHLFVGVVNANNSCQEHWVCTPSGTCSASGQQSQTCYDSNHCGTIVYQPPATISCTPPPPTGCDWVCPDWSTCTNGQQTRYCTAPTSACAAILGGPATTQTQQCTSTPPTQPTMTVTSPNGGETWKVGETHNITWTSQNLPSSETMDISFASGSNPGDWVAVNVPNNGSYSWTVPSSLTPASNYFINIQDYYNGQYVSNNSSSFTISAATSTCTPNWTCQWGACINSSQGQNAVDTNNCGISAPAGTCPTTRVCHNVCDAISKKCTPLYGSGINQCSIDNDCTTLHNVCISNKCVIVGGAGSSSCLIDDDCAPAPVCVPNWQCLGFGTCVSGQQTQTCTDTKNCGTTTGKPATSQSCTMPVAYSINLSWKPVGGHAGSLGLYDPSTSKFYLKSTQTTGIGFGMPGAGWLPLLGDWTYKSYSSIGLYNPSSSIFYLKNNNTTGAADTTFAFGSPGAGWLPIVGDWDGNGTDTVGLYDPGTSQFYLKNSNTTGYADIQFGFGAPGAGWLPIAGDWNNDGTDTVGLYDPSTGTTYLKNSNTTGTADITRKYDVGYIPLTIKNSVAGSAPQTYLVEYSYSGPGTASFYIKNSDGTNYSISNFTSSGWGGLASSIQQNSLASISYALQLLEQQIQQFLSR